jgi:hypothetical protein
MANESLSINRKETVNNDFKAHQQLAQLVSKVVQEMENGTTQAMIAACYRGSGH